MIAICPEMPLQQIQQLNIHHAKLGVSGASPILLGSLLLYDMSDAHSIWCSVLVKIVTSTNSITVATMLTSTRHQAKRA